MAVTSYAYDFEVDGIYYCYDVYGNAVVTHGDKKYTGKIKIPSEVKWNGKKKKGVSRNLVGINFRHPNVMPNFAVWKTITYRHWHRWCCQPRF